jgi:uncharacterized protein YjbJ (UPF0337 family)
MSQDRIKGVAKMAKGSVEQTAGKVTGNKRMQAKGAVEKAVGSAQNKLGKAEDKAAAARRRV